MKRYLFTWLLSLLAFWSFGQGDIPLKEDVVSPPAGFVRPFARDGGVDYRLPDGSIWKGRRIRDPKLYYIWPPYLIQNPVNGDQAIGPSATADTSQRQYAIYNGARWVEYGQPVPPVLTFGSAFSKAGTTVNLNQYPNTIGDIFADRLSVKEPVKATNPQQHSFILYNPASGTFERIPYVDILSAFGVNQWPYSLGKIGVDALYWATVPNQVSAEGLNLSNARFLMQLGNSTVAMSMGEYKLLLEKTFGLNQSGKSLRRVAPVANQNAPGEVGDYFFHAGRMHLNIEKVNGQNAWIRWAPDTLFSYNIVNPSPAAILAYTGNPTPTSLSFTWTYAGSPTGFTLYASRNDTLNYQAVATIAAGARSYTLTNAVPNSIYHLRLQALTASGTSPLSNRVVATTSGEDNFTQWPNVRNVVIKQSGPQQFKIEFDIYEDGGGVRFEISKKANPNPAADPDYNFAVGKALGAAGHYELYVDGITDSEVRNFRFRRESSSADGKTPSSYGTYGPVSIQGSGVTVNTPAITSTSEITQSSVKLNLNFNNSNIAKAWLYQSLASVQNFTRTEIPTTSTTYTVTGLQPGTKYLFHIQVSKLDGTTEVFSANSSPETEVTTTGDNSNNVCSFSTTASGGYEATTKTFTMAHTGKVYFMLDAGQIPDKLTVKKNGTIVANPYAASWRTAGSVDVVPGDVIEFVIDPKVTGDMGTGWTLYANCSTPYNVDTPQGNNNYGNRDFPHITSVARSTSGTRTYTITATPARATGAAIVGYKAVRAIRSFRADEGWSTSNVISRDQAGEVLYGDESYVIYVKDANSKMYGIAGITSGGSYPEDIPAANPVQFTVTNITSSQATLVVANAGSGSKNYNWAIYYGAFNEAGSDFMGYAAFNVASTGTLVVTFNNSEKKLVAGTTYRMYLNLSNNPDATRNWVEFTIPKPTDPPPASTGTLKASAYSTSN